MAAPSRSRHRKRARLRVGDRVSFVFGLDRVVGTIIEDRGNIGFRGRRLLRVRVPRSDTDDLVAEVPEENVRSA